MPSICFYNKTNLTKNVEMENKNYNIYKHKFICQQENNFLISE